MRANGNINILLAFVVGGVSRPADGIVRSEQDRRIIYVVRRSERSPAIHHTACSDENNAVNEEEGSRSIHGIMWQAYRRP
jgi:hypothetical protein